MTMSGSNRCHYQRQRRRVEYVDHDRLYAGPLQLGDFRLRPGRAENFIIGIDQQRSELPADHSTCAGKKDFPIHTTRVSPFNSSFAPIRLPCSVQHRWLPTRKGSLRTQ